jgi:hypothetical protein
MIDVDGKFTFSNTVLLITKTAVFMVENVYPNPVTNNTTTLQLNAYQKEVLNIIFTDVLGRTIKKQYGYYTGWY